jgi:lysophospholipase L1-like esterase
MFQPIILFQGDSITDCNRFVNNDLGDGYVNNISKMYPNAIIINKGISGNKTFDLLSRWNEDTIALKPEVLSILVGVNDIWHRYSNLSTDTFDDFKNNYRILLTETKKLLPNTKILLIEPYLLVSDAFQASWRHEVDLAIQVVRSLASEYADAFIPLDGLMAEAAFKYGKNVIMWDGIHPTPFGHELIASIVSQKISELIKK